MFSFLPPWPIKINPSLLLPSCSSVLEFFSEGLAILLPVTFTYVHAPTPSTLHHKLSVGRNGSPIFGGPWTAEVVSYLQ